MIPGAEPKQLAVNGDGDVFMLFDDGGGIVGFTRSVAGGPVWSGGGQVLTYDPGTVAAGLAVGDAGDVIVVEEVGAIVTRNSLHSS